MNRLPRLIAACFLLSLTPRIVAAPDPDPVLPPGADVIEVVFDQEPAERGLVFEREGAKPAEVTLKGQTSSAWVLDDGLDRSMRWLRPFRFRVTDERFLNGGRPAVDLEVTFHNPGQGSVRVKADTADGAQPVGSLWGNSKDWKTLRIPLDNAFFGHRVDPADSKPLLGEYDLRIDGINGPFYLKRVRLVGYNPDQDVLWSRMLKIADVVAPTPGGVLAYGRRADARFDVKLQNLARVERKFGYRLQIVGHDDTVRHRVDAEAVLAPSGTLSLPFGFDTTGWPLGPYEARLELYLGKSRARPVVSRTFRLGVVSDAELAKARPGEFLYGLDAANNTIFPILTPAAFAYYRLMGVDMLRNPYNKGMRENVDELADAIARLAAEDVRSAVMIDPPKDLDAGKRAAQLQTKVAFIEEAARRLAGRGPGRVHYFEMGNEPDLTHFYPAEIPTYIESYVQMYDAVKRGARAAGLADTDTVVMNGGLSFAGGDGVRRAAEFVEKIDASKIDAIGYHGHGAGIAAERSAYERLLRVAEKHGKANLPFIETESGFSGVDRIGLAEQARTVVEKMTYAQSKGMPMFIFFRLFMEGAGVEGGYTMAENFIEPRPSVLSYRNMVERLRHHRFERVLDFAGEAGADGVVAFLFAELDAAGQPAGRKTLVAFCEKPISYELRLGLDQPGVDAASVRGFDLYGNPLAVDASRGVASFPVGIDPVYVEWTSRGTAADARVMPPLLSVDATAPLLPGADNALALTVRNPRQDRALDVELDLSVKTRLGAKVAPATTKVSIPAGGVTRVPFSIHLDRADRPLAMPAWWTVFTDVDRSALTPAVLAGIPATLPASDGGEPVAGRAFASPGGRLNLSAIAGGHGENRHSVASAYLDSPSATELEVGASGDWFMAWYLNGEKVQDTLDTGNGQHGPISLHPFKLRLKAGRNVIAVIVGSGRHGWEINFGGPKELRVARDANDDPDTVTVTMKSADGATLAHQTEPLAIGSAVPPLGVSTGEWPANWLRLEPLAVLGSDAVVNHWVKEPDQTRWYAGERDLSAVVWLREDAGRLRILAAVSDDRVVQAPSVAGLGSHDAARLLLADASSKPLLDMTAGLVGGKAAATSAPSGVEFDVVRREGADATTYYQWTLPAGLTKDAPFTINLLVTDNDAGYLKQTLSLGNVNAPTEGRRAIAR